MLKVWGRRSSFNVQKVLWFLGELDVEYQHIPAGGSLGRLDEPEFRKLNPHGRVPVLEDGTLAVWESHSILRYLAAKYGAPIFWSDDAGERSLIDRWMDWSQTALQPDFLTGVFWGYYRTPEEQRDRLAVEKSISQCAEHFRLLDTILAQHRYLVGDRLSLADIPAGTSLYRYFNLAIERPRVPHVEAWYDQLQQRQHYRQQVMVPFGDLRGRVEY